MSYQVLARRWRPQRFSEVVGQEHITRTLVNALKQNRLAHAFLFTGPRGVGKTSTARILARAVNCTNIDLKGDAEPCNECDICKALLEDRELDVIEMDAASYTGVDDIRRINESARLAPVAGSKKIYVIDEVHMLSRSAFNAFLKTLEEPPAHVIFILATTDVHKVPATVLSRVQRFDFRPIAPVDIAPFLKKICDHEKWETEEEALWLIARKSEGSLRDAEGLLDQIVSYGGNRITLTGARDVLGVLPEELLAKATLLLAERKTSEIPEFIDNLAERGVDYTEVLRDLQNYWMDLIFLKQDLPLMGRSQTDIDAMLEAGNDLNIDDCFRLIRLAEDLENDLRWSPLPRVRFEVSFLRWANMDRTVTIRDILDRLESGARPARHTAESRSTPGETKSNSTPPPSAQSKTAPSPGKITLDTLHSNWPSILRALGKKKPAVAAAAESSWSVVKIEGRKVYLSTSDSSRFARDQMTDSFGDLSSAIEETLGVKLLPVLSVGESPAEKPKAAAPETPPKIQQEGDLFNSFLKQFGGEEIDTTKTRESKNNS